jgi:tetratricopeptide (TPR) repeat protein/transcriptional regulator with XRE-family HTH domain
MTKIARTRLIEERKRRQWSQQEVASLIGTTQRNVSRWELGLTTPGAYFRAKLCELFDKRPADLGLIPELTEEEDPPPSPSVSSCALTSLPTSTQQPWWHVPYLRNPFFTGRDAILQQLHHVLKHERGVGQPEPDVPLTHIYALRGLGGIGKTQTATEYAYRYVHEYTALVWIRADASESIFSSFVSFAELLRLPETQEHDQNKIVAAVLRWLSCQRGWLLIFDNVEDLELVKRFLPTAPHGGVLLTTRIQALGTLAHPIDLPLLTVEEGTVLLLKRSRRIASHASLEQISSAEYARAKAISATLGGLPLALDQAGAYIEETHCSLEDYQSMFQTHPAVFLNERQAHLDHPLSVVKTFTLAFENVARRSPAAADLLRACALLHPDAIVEEIFTRGAIHLGPHLTNVSQNLPALNKVLAIVGDSGLLYRQTTEKMCSIHRLVQIVLQDLLEDGEKQIWAKRVVCAITAVFPHAEFSSWSQCERLLSQALQASQLIDHYQIRSAQAGRLLYETACYLSERARYSEAEPLFLQALRVKEHSAEEENPQMVEVLTGLANLYADQGRYEKAEPLYQRALLLGEQSGGPDDPHLARPLNGLAVLYWEQGRYDEAESRYQRALQILEKALGPDHPDLARPLNNLANLYHSWARYEEAEELFQRAIQILEHHVGSEHPDVGNPLTSLADLYWEQGRYNEAEYLWQRVLRCWESTLGPDHPDVAYPLTGLANLYLAQNKTEKAEQLFQRALALREQRLGFEHPLVASPLIGLANLYLAQGRYEEAERRFQRALVLQEQHLGIHHPEVARTVSMLTVLRQKQDEPEMAISSAERLSS